MTYPTSYTENRVEFKLESKNKVVIRFPRFIDSHKIDSFVPRKKYSTSGFFGYWPTCSKAETLVMYSVKRLKIKKLVLRHKFSESIILGKNIFVEEIVDHCGNKICLKNHDPHVKISSSQTKGTTLVVDQGSAFVTSVDVKDDNVSLHLRSPVQFSEKSITVINKLKIDKLGSILKGKGLFVSKTLYQSGQMIKVKKLQVFGKVNLSESARIDTDDIGFESEVILRKNSQIKTKNISCQEKILLDQSRLISTESFMCPEMNLENLSIFAFAKRNMDQILNASPDSMIIKKDFSQKK